MTHELPNSNVKEETNLNKSGTNSTLNLLTVLKMCSTFF
jgi:hypothetical protein